MRLAAAEERAARAEWEARDAAQAAARELGAARAEAADWKREATAAEAERGRAAAAAKLARRGSASSAGGTPLARGAPARPRPARAFQQPSAAHLPRTGGCRS